MFNEQTEEELDKLRLTLTGKLYSDQRRQLRKLELEMDSLRNHNMHLQEDCRKLREGLFNLMEKFTAQLSNTKRGSKAEKCMFTVIHDLQELF